MFIDVVIYLLFCVPGHPHDRPVLSPVHFVVMFFRPFWKQETLSLCQVTHQFTSLQNGLPNPYASNPLRDTIRSKNSWHGYIPGMTPISRRFRISVGISHNKMQVPNLTVSPQNASKKV